MIAYDLKCAPHGHGFEGWFRSREDYDAQKTSGMLTCPVCGSPEIERALSAPYVGMKSNRRAPVSRQPRTAPPADDKAESAPPVMSGSPELPPQVREALAKIAEAQGKMLEKSEWVGGKFVEEVRAQHYGEADERLVHGQASAVDAAELAEEGISVMPVLFPVAPLDKRN